MNGRNVTVDGKMPIFSNTLIRRLMSNTMPQPHPISIPYSFFCLIAVLKMPNTKAAKIQHSRIAGRIPYIEVRQVRI